jgi:ABC-type glycerol-3-phosphate transport system substrate-binding protein
MLNYLRTGRNIAPTILPDLILLPADQLTIANNEQLIYPISPYLTQEDINDLFPPALDIATIGEELMGYPHTLSGLTHLVYNPTIFTDTVPALWSQLIQTNASLTLPTNNGLPATLIMQIYFELGGSLLNENNRFFLDQTTLSQAFAQIQKARQAEVLSLQSIDTDDYAQAWASLTTGNANMTILDSQRYLIERQTDTSYLYASIPGFDTPLKPILSGWVWVLTTADPETQQQASDLIHFLTSPETLGKWSFEHQLIPARPSAFATWSPNDPYANFLQTELNHSDPNPTISNNNLNNLLQEEFFNIINLISSPDEAAQRIVTQINQP